MLADVHNLVGYNGQMNKELIRNLKLTPQQRIEEHQKALNLLLELQKISPVKPNARPQSAS